jgi:hypothetical protein
MKTKDQAGRHLLIKIVSAIGLLTGIWCWYIYFGYFYCCFYCCVECYYCNDCYCCWCDVYGN